MKILFGAKDGGPASRVWVWGIESKLFGSVLLLKFARGSREAFHTHAFNAVSWLLSGELHEVVRYGDAPGLNAGFDSVDYRPSLRPIVTKRERFHMVRGMAGASWALTLRGPWVDQWNEFLPRTRRFITLTHGRKEI
jgi:hypothetical protein